MPKAGGILLGIGRSNGPGGDLREAGDVGC